jgi:amino acid transporter
MSSETVAPLKRALGLRDVALFMVTAGCSLQWAATAAAAGPSSLVVWVLGGLVMFLPLSVCVVFMSSRHPDHGGLYVWSKLAFGPFVGFMTGWTYWTANLPFFSGMLYFVAGSALFFGGERGALAGASPAYFIGFSIGALILAVVLNLRGLTAATWLTSAGAVARWVGTLLLVVLGLSVVATFGAATSIDRAALVPGFHIADIVFWSTIAFAWTGPEAASFMAGEIRDPQRTVPRAFAIAAPMIAGVYLLSTASVLVSTPSEHVNALYGVMDAIASDAHRLGFAWLIPLGAACLVLDRLGSVCAWLGAVARIPFVAGLDQYLPRSFARLHPRYGSPTTSLWVQAALAAAFTVLGQAGQSVRSAYNVLVAMMVVATLLPFVPLFAAAIRLSFGTPVAGEVRIPGGRVTVIFMALVGLATTLGAIALAFVPPADEDHPVLVVLKLAAMTLLVLLGGAAVYGSGRARARRHAATTYREGEAGAA